MRRIASRLRCYIKKHSVCEHCGKESMQCVGEPVQCPHCRARKLKPKRGV